METLAPVDLVLHRSRTAAPPRLPLSTLVPICDAVALAGSVAATDRGAVAVAYGVLGFLALAASGTHGNRIHPQLGFDLPRIVAALATPLPLLSMVPGLTSAVASLLPRAPIVMLTVVLGRWVAYELIRAARAHREIVEPTLVVGSGTLAERVVRTMLDHPEYGLVPVGFIDGDEGGDPGAPYLGGTDDLTDVVRRHGIRRIVIAYGSAREAEMIPVLRACDRLPVEVHVVPRLFELGVGPQGPTTDDLRGLPLMRLRRAALRTAAWRTKRVVDVVGSSLILLLTSPLFVAAAVAVRLSSPGPIFFRQRRLGQRGEPFDLLKFRTMRENADGDTTWSVRDDERRTKVGIVLRRTGLDELPQLLNVLSGQMSLVGPRPERPLFVDRFRVAVHGYDDRHRVPAGVTGWAQVHGLRGDTSIEARAVYDNHYIEHWSLWLDAVILARTISTVLRGDGA